MITVAEIRKKAERIYSEVLRDCLSERESCPIIIRADKNLSKDFVRMSQEIAQIMSDSKDRKGYGYTIQSELIKTKLHSFQDIPKSIVFETLFDFLKFIGKEEEYQKFVEQSKCIFMQYPELKELFLCKPELIISNFNKWDDLLKVCSWFLNSFEAERYYIRELPIAVPTKFIEENKPTLKVLLEELIPDKINANEIEFEKRFHLKYAQPFIRFRYLDKNIKPAFEYSDISVPLEQFLNIPINCQKIMIIENLMNFLTFPLVQNAIAIWGKGFAIDCLKHSYWFENKMIYYWSDLDVQGFQMLSQLRSYFPQAQSFLMDMETLHSYKDFWIKGTPTYIKELNFLNESERSTFLFLKESNIRLEQERIMQSEVIRALALTIFN